MNLSKRLIRIHVTTRSVRNSVEASVDPGIDLHIRTTAPAHDGKANEHVIRLLSDSLSVSKSRIAITKGFKSRIKTIEIRYASG